MQFFEFYGVKEGEEKIHRIEFIKERVSLHELYYENG
jgi:hypothetical protein